MDTESNLRIVDCTLREGEQFARAAFRSDERRGLARALDAVGVDVDTMGRRLLDDDAMVAVLDAVVGWGLDAVDRRRSAAE